MKDKSFLPSESDLALGSELLINHFTKSEGTSYTLPEEIPEKGLGENKTLKSLASKLVGIEEKLGKESAFAHMDPPTPWISWIVSSWKAALNQNLLHPSTSRFSKIAEDTVISWLSKFYGQSGGQMVPGSTIANLSALWVARDQKKITKVIASDQSHVSIKKACQILGLEYEEVPSKENLQLDADQISNMVNSTTALVLTAGTTSSGTIDPLREYQFPWVHVDAAWGGPIKLSKKYQNLLKGIEKADSIAISAHKLFFQPKDSALLFFKDWDRAKKTISFGGSYLAEPNVGVMGSKGAMAEPLLATLLCWGREGFEKRIDRCMDNSLEFAKRISSESKLELFEMPQTGVTLWRPKNSKWEKSVLGYSGSFSTTSIKGEKWIRNVSANPNLDIEKVWSLAQKLF